MIRLTVLFPTLLFCISCETTVHIRITPNPPIIRRDGIELRPDLPQNVDSRTLLDIARTVPPYFTVEERVLEYNYALEALIREQNCAEICRSQFHHDMDSMALTCRQVGFQAYHDEQYRLLQQALEICSSRRCRRLDDVFVILDECR